MPSGGQGAHVIKPVAVRVALAVIVGVRVAQSVGVPSKRLARTALLLYETP
ncbi:MAG: hypothetical protein H6Q33_4373 [Deltaproteobacteria bacterium]|nr:hypothetical protein [Deltaproteobacteria bacterium]